MGRKKSNDPIEDSYKIKVPVFVTEKTDKELTYSIVVESIKKKIDTYNNDRKSEKVKFTRANKTQTKVIDSILCIDRHIGEQPSGVPCLLLQVTTYTTNHIEGFIQDEENADRKKIKQTTKLGSEENYILFYPNIKGIDLNKKSNWIILVYSDINKTDSDIINTAKLLIEKVFGLLFLHVKPTDVLKEISNSKIPKFQIKYIGIDNSDNGVDEKYREYLSKTQVKKDKVSNYKQLPFSLAKELYNETENFESEGYQKKEATFTFGNNKYKLTKELIEHIEEAQNVMSESAEQIYTDNFLLYESEKENVYDHDFIIEKLSPIITKYLKSYDV